MPRKFSVEEQTVLPLDGDVTLRQVIETHFGCGDDQLLLGPVTVIFVSYVICRSFRTILNRP